MLKQSGDRSDEALADKPLLKVSVFTLLNNKS